MDVSQFDYILPEKLIAQTPSAERTGSRLLSLNKRTGQIKHDQFASFIDFINEGDTLVLNNTKVIPARLFGIKRETGAKAEVLLLKSLGDDRWDALVRPAKKLKIGDTIVFGLPNGDLSTGGPSDKLGELTLLQTPLLSATIEAESDMGGRVLRFHYEGIFNELLDQLGQMPLPPYIKQQLEEKERYQTVYAKYEGSAAAPTAGLHFSLSYLEEIRRKGIAIVYVTLHVGLGTFRPVNAERVEDHVMHDEFYHMSEETAKQINETRARGGRVIAVGTTSARTLEAVAQSVSEKYGSPLSQMNSEAHPLVETSSGWTDIFIYPGYAFKVVDAILTNFHLPKSTLMMLISAFADREQVLQAYEEAVSQEYRFFSFGDAMFIY